MPAFFTIIHFLWIYYVNIKLLHSQTCLSSPQAITHNANGNDIEWTEISSNTFSTRLIFDVSTQSWPDLAINAEITTRLFNNSLPSQTLRFKRGNKYQITVINNLGPESIHNPTAHNVPKDPNTTNIHTHGLHLSGEIPSDNVFVTIGPGEEYTYYYHIPCDHSGGLFWWHPHHHGSTHLHVAGGAAGALIIEDDQIAEGLPDWYVNMPELIFFITHIHLLKYGSMVNYTWDYVWSYTRPLPNRPPGNIDTFFVNGKFQPTICMNAGEWMKFRFAQVETTEDSRIFYIGNGECKQYLLARDGVMVHGINDSDIPRMVGNGIWLAQSSRADVAISCPGDLNIGYITYDIWTNNTGIRQVIAFIKVTGTHINTQTLLTPFTPIRPNYLQNLLNGYYFGDFPTQQYPSPDDNNILLNYWKDMLVTGAAIGGRNFISESSYLQYIEINTINTWQVTNFGNNIHPLHIHINHFQMLNSSLSELISSNYDNWINIPNGYQVIGDWYDTIWGPAFIRFKTDTFAGTVAMHCHILIHEDQGAMATIKIINGCNHNYIDYNNNGKCDYNYTDSCEYEIPYTTQTTQASQNTMVSYSITTSNQPTQTSETTTSTREKTTSQNTMISDSETITSETTSNQPTVSFVDTNALQPSIKQTINHEDEAYIVSVNNFVLMFVSLFIAQLLHC
eukprot:458798_1